MSARTQLIHLAAKGGILLVALFLVTVLLAAMPGHRTPVVQSQESQQSPPPKSEQLPAMEPNMPGMDPCPSAPPKNN